MEGLVTIINSLEPLIIVANHSILDNCLGPDYTASEHDLGMQGKRYSTKVKISQENSKGKFYFNQIWQPNSFQLYLKTSYSTDVFLWHFT